MNNRKSKIAIFVVMALLVFSVVSGLILPYWQNRDIDTVDKDSGTQTEKVMVPNFEFMDRDGNVVEFDSFKGKPVVINFWGTWCPYCVMEMDDFNTAVGEYGDDVNFLFLDVANSEEETVEKVDEFLADNGYDNIVSYYDNPGYGIYMFGINSFPTTVYVDSEGYLYDATIGLTNYDDLKAVLDSML